jgi:hypothetical protein
MRRRDFIRFLGGLAAAGQIAVRAQQHSRKLPRIGWLVPGSQLLAQADEAIE